MNEYNDYFLKFADEAEMDTVYLQPTEDDEGITYPDCFMDVVGLVVDQPAELDEEGEVVTPATFVDGWHVNVRCAGDLPGALQGYEIEAPATPERVWA